MPADTPTLPTNTPTASVFSRYPNIAPQVYANLPEAGSPPISAAEIHQRIDLGAPLTIRAILGEMRRHGVVASTLVPRRNDCFRRLYTKAPNADNYEDAREFYGDGA
jgi:hypothetical protein